MKYLLLCFTLALLCTSCATYDDPITTKQNSKKKAFQTKTLRNHDLIGHVHSCSTQIYEYTKAPNPDFKAKEGSITNIQSGSHSFPKEPGYSEYIEFNVKGKYVGTLSSNGLGIHSDSWIAAFHDDDEKKQKSLKGSKKQLDDKGNCTEEKTKEITVTYQYDSIGNCIKRTTKYHNSSFRDITIQTFTYDTLGNWTKRVTQYKYKPDEVPNPYVKEKITRVISYWPPEAIPKENKVLTYLSRSNLIVLLFSLL